MINRRHMLTALGAAAAAPVWAAKRPLEPLTPGIKITLQMPTDFNDDDLKFAKQIGVAWVNTGTTGGTYETFADIKRRVEAAGLKLSNVGNTNVHNMQEVTLNLPGRDQKIEEYKQYLRNLSRAGIYYTTYAHMGNGIWSSGRAPIRGASGREFDLASPKKKGVWGDKSWQEPLSHG